MLASEQIFVEFALAVTAMKSRAALNFGLSMAERGVKAQRNARDCSSTPDCLCNLASPFDVRKHFGAGRSQ